MRQICSAISFCHQKGVIHRDLKPENVLFDNLQNMTIKVVDFGIAGICKGNEKERTDAGTIRYMPPEVF
jgi:serine/threonine protein kinase